MKQFTDEAGVAWIASAREERTPRHHQRWYLVFHPAADEAALLVMPEVRWQTRATAERTLRTMSEFELRRRLHTVRERALQENGASPDDGAPLDSFRARTSANAG
jgi:hypothetical protein